MTRWRKNYYVVVGRDEQGFYVNRGWQIYSRTPLSNGQILRLEFSVTHDPYADILTPHLVVHSPYAIRRWRKQGTAVGPGGTEVWGLMANLWDGGIAEARKRLTKNARVEVQVDAANDRLYRIYRHLLSKRGYHDSGDIMWTELQSA